MIDKPLEITASQERYPSIYLNFVVRCWLRADGRVSGYFVETPSGVRYPFGDVASLTDSLWRRIRARQRPEGHASNTEP